jgi:multiple sugar transport system substrate-binding protein
MKNLFHKPLYISLLILTTVSLSGAVCKGGSTEAKNKLAQPVALEWWGTNSNSAAVNEIINDYKNLHPNISVNYRQFRPEEFETALLRAMAAQKGPDIITLSNSSLRAWQDYLEPLPATITLPFIQMTGFIKKEPEAVLQTGNTMTLDNLRENFVDVVPQDVIIDNKIYGLPLSLDTLLIYYNRDLLNAAGFAKPPATWTEFKDATEKITRIDKQGRLLQNGVAMGEANNVLYAADILVALMLQNGTKMIDSSGTRATFNQQTQQGNETYSPGADAVRFYTDFANPSKETYSWSKEEPATLKAFASGKLGFMFGYWRDYNTIKAQTPGINLDIANFPQIDNTTRPTYYASYFVQAITKQSKYVNEAWGLLHFAARAEEAQKYLSSAKQPSAHRQFYQTQVQDPNLGLPAKQLLTAKSWYRGFNYKEAEKAILELINQINSGTTITQALEFAAQKVTQTLYKTSL